MANNDIIVSEMTSATQINTGDLMIMTQPDLQSETGYSTKKGTVLQVANKMLKGTEYTTDLPDFTHKNVLEGMEELKGDLTSLLPIDTASGAIANFETDLALDLVDCKASILASQASGTPTPSNPLAITGYTGVNLTRCGKNLFDRTKAIDGIWQADGTYTTSNTYQTIYCRVKPSTSYTISGTENFDNLRLCQFNTLTPTTFTSRTPYNGASYTFTTSADTKMISVSPTTSSFEASTSIQLEEGSTATAYTAYNGTTYPVSWQDEAGTVYGGNLDLTTGVLTVTHAYVSNLGNFSWSPVGTGTAGKSRFYCSDFANVIKKPASSSTVADLTCSGFSAITVDQTYGCINGLAVHHSNGYLYAYYEDYATYTGEQFKTAMSGISLAYELATPVTYQLTPTQVRALVGVNNVFNDTNGNTEVSYKEGIQHYIDKKIAQTQALIL